LVGVKCFSRTGERFSFKFIESTELKVFCFKSVTGAFQKKKNQKQFLHEGHGAPWFGIHCQESPMTARTKNFFPHLFCIVFQQKKNSNETSTFFNGIGSFVVQIG